MTEQETLEDHLRRATRNFSARLPEDAVLTLGRDLARELQRAHSETPPRFPELEPSAVPMVDGKPSLAGTRAGGDAGEDLFQLGGLLCWLASGTRPDVSWRLDGPPSPPLSTLARRAALATLAAPRRGDPARRGSGAGTGTGTVAPVWDARVGPVNSSPALTAALVVVAAADGRLLFLDRRSGRQVHEVKLASAIESSPSLADDLLHVGTDDGELVAVGLAQGEERWRIKLGQLVRSSPLVTGGRAYVGVVEGKTGGALVALDAAKGKAAWVRKMGSVFSSPTLAGKALLIGSDDGSVYAIDPDRGGVLWSYALGGKVRATAATSGELAVTGSFDGRVAALRVADGSVAWSAALGHSIYSSPCIVEGLAVLGCHEGHVHGFELATGRSAFEAQTKGPVVASPVASGSELLVGSTDGALYVIDLQGRILQRQPLSPRGVQSSAAVDAKIVIAHV